MSDQDQDNSKTRAQIFLGWSRGVSTETLATGYGKSTEEIRIIVDDEKAKRPRPSRLDPMEVIRDHILRVEAVIEELATAAGGTKGAPRVRAIMGRFEALKYYLEMMRMVGVVPQGGNEATVFIDAVRLSEKLVDLLEERDLLTDELAHAIEGAFAAEADQTPIPLVPVR